MKRVFEKPVMNVELFVANQAVSACDIEGGINYTFDCMYGPNVDTATVINDIIAAGCDTKIGYAVGKTIARDYSSGGSHSTNSDRGTWEIVRNGGKIEYLQVTYSGAEGLLYTDGEGGKYDSCWSEESGFVKHSSSRGGTHHMVAPVIDSRSVNASW